MGVMQQQVLTVASSVIAKASREEPADAVLRTTLKEQRGLTPEIRHAVAQAVFSYYRWRGWLDSGQPVGDQIRRARELTEQFHREPMRFADSELSERSVPGWVKDVIEIPPGWPRAIQAEPRLWLRARPGQGQALAGRMGSCRIPDSPALADAVEYLGPQDLFRTPGFHTGEFELQNISSQVVGLVCAPVPGQTWWDVCAGEGGKLLHLSDLMRNKGLIWASDRAEWRLRRLKRRTARAQVFNYRSVVWDGGERLPFDTKFDGVLLDAPCSGLGTWQRHAHARWTTRPDDVTELAAVQRQLLGLVAPAVKPGGKLIYAVCTMTRAETREIVAAFSAAAPDFQVMPIINPFAPDAPAASELCLWPQDCGGHGMFIAAWRRN
jgi:16S rRNA (cytosine967-C5)-methyltransferase